MQALVDTSPVSPDLRNGWAWNIEECEFMMGFATWNMQSQVTSIKCGFSAFFSQRAPCFSAKSATSWLRWASRWGEWDALQPPCRSLAGAMGIMGGSSDLKLWNPRNSSDTTRCFFLDLIWFIYGLYGDIWIIDGWHSRSREKVLLTSDLRRMQSFSSKPVASSWDSAAMEEVKLICSKMSLDLH